MTAPEYLRSESHCVNCDGFLPKGSVVRDEKGTQVLAYVKAPNRPNGKGWAHANPSCNPLVRSAPPLAPARAPAVTQRSLANGPNAAAERSLPSPASKEPSPRACDPDGRHGWSVSVEIHEAEDPALRKRIVKVSRIYLDSLDEAANLVPLLEALGAKGAR